MLTLTEHLDTALRAVLAARRAAGVGDDPVPVPYRALALEEALYFSAILRLQGGDPADLVLLAEALHQRFWEGQERAQTSALQRLDKDFQPNVMGALGMMADKIEKIAAQVADLAHPYVIEMQQYLAAKHVQETDSRLLLTLPQRGVRIVGLAGKAVLNKLSMGAVKEAEGEFKDWVKALRDDRRR